LKNEYNEDVLEDSAFNNLDPIFSNKEEYLENVRNEINKPDFEGVISYLNNNNKCCHFYHEECKKRGKNKNNCYFCNYYISITNIIVFQEIDKISFVNVMKFIHNLSEKCECNYKKNVINAVYDFIQNDETFDEKLKEEIKKRHKLARKFINNLNYKSTFEISLKEDVEEYEVRYEREKEKKDERREREEEERRERDREKQMQKEIEKEQNKKIRLKICSKCSRRCAICKGSGTANSYPCYAHNKCWNIDNCIVCGGRATNFFTSLCNNCKNQSFRHFNCLICRKHV